MSAMMSASCFDDMPKKSDTHFIYSAARYELMRAMRVDYAMRDSASEMLPRERERD